MEKYPDTHMFYVHFNFTTKTREAYW